ncbi:MAG: sulfotransferase [Alphaproteobacteria bacterium]|nr:sulfotransferase [Alphaproteobacteria bacterium]
MTTSDRHTPSLSEAVAIAVQSLEGDTGSGRHLVVISQPKSASTFLANILSVLTGFPVTKYSDPHIHDYAFSYGVARRIRDQDAIIHLHSHPTVPLIGWLKAKGVVPAILHRDLPDSVVSLYDHSRASGYKADAKLERVAREIGLKATAYTWAGWLIRYQAHWSGNLQNKVLDGLWIDYADLVAEPEMFVQQILARNGFEFDLAACHAAVEQVSGDRVRSNLNKGVAGRGADLPADLLKDLDAIKAAI